MFENPRRGRQARNCTTNVPKILDLKSSSEQIFSENLRWVSLIINNSKQTFVQLGNCGIVTLTHAKLFQRFRTSLLIFGVCSLLSMLLEFLTPATDLEVALPTFVTILSLVVCRTSAAVTSNGVSAGSSVFAWSVCRTFIHIYGKREV